MKRKVWLSLAALVLVVVPLVTLAQAQGLVPCTGAPGDECQLCRLVQLIDQVTTWLIGILSIIAAIMIAYGGYLLVTSAGNTGQKEQAKKLVTNTIIGFVIVLAAWLLIDLMMQMLIGGQINGGPWNQIQCVPQPSSRVVTVGLQQGTQTQIGCTPSGAPPGSGVPAFNCSAATAQCTAQGGTGTVNSSGSAVNCAFSGGGGSAQSISCDPTNAPPGSGIPPFNCSNALSQCTTQGGTGTVNSSGSAVNCVFSGGGGSCNVVTDPNNACHPNNMSCFNNPQAASQVCNLESAGGRTGALSGSDICQDGSSFSVGLWQINLLVNSHLIPGCPSGVFSSPSCGSNCQGQCVQHRTNSNGVTYCARWDCQVVNQAGYNTCVTNAQNPQNNTSAACQLYSTQGRNAWLTSANTCGVNP